MRLIICPLLIAAAAPAAIRVTLAPSVPSPAPVGYMVTWTAESDATSATLWYRFRTRLAGGEFATIRDFSPVDSLDWTASEREGIYEVEVSVQNKNTGETAQTLLPFEFWSQVTEGAPVINSTVNPLVFLYSAPVCPAGSRMRVQFQSDDGFLQSTPEKSCQQNLSMNFYLAGMRPSTQYSVKHIVSNGPQRIEGPTLSLTTPEVSIPIAGYNVLQ